MEERVKGQDLFEIVGINYQEHVPVLKNSSAFEQLRTKPVISILFLVLIFGGCLFSGMLVNHNPGDFFWII